MIRFKTGLVLFVLVAFQVSVFAHLRPFGAAPDLLLVAAIVGGVVGGPDFGARNGFAAGLLLDLVIPGPFGLAAGVYATIGFGVGQFSRSVDSSDRRVAVLLSALSGFLATVVYGLALGVLGSEQFVEWRLAGVAAAVGLYSVLLNVPIRVAYLWALTSDSVGPRSEAAQGVMN